MMKLAVILLLFLFGVSLAYCTTTCATPTFSINGGTFAASSIPVTITSTTQGSVIRYTLDGTTPSETSGNIYTTAVSLTQNCRLQAIAYEAGYADSPIASANFIFQSIMPHGTPPAGPYTTPQIVTLSAITGCSIRYTTDGSTPTETWGTLYTTPLNINQTTYIYAIAYRAGWTDSAIGAIPYFLSCATPTFSPAPGTYATAQNVSINCATPGATIRYTIDGSTPTEINGTIYTGPVPITAYSTTLKAIAYITNWTDSSVASGTYTITNGVATPTFMPTAGSYPYQMNVSIFCATTGASIRYTTDGSSPTPTSGTLYTGAITPQQSLTFNAIAYKSGMSNSNVSSSSYTIQCNPAGASVMSGQYSTPQTITLSSGTPGVTIRYTIDNSPPSETNGTIYTVPLVIDATTNLKTIAYKSGLADSSVQTYGYGFSFCAAPTFTPGAGTYNSTQYVTIGCHTPGVTIRYTTDGNTPNHTVGTSYTAPVPINATTTLKAIAYENGYTDSAVTTGVYTLQAATPAMTPAPGTYAAPVTVSMTTSSPGATIHYTTDGTTPSSSHGIVYNGPITISNTTTLNAIATETGWTDSTVASGTYTIPTYIITPLPTGNGTITPNTAQTVSSGSNLTFTATPNLGFIVADWYLDANPNPAQVGGNSFTITNITANHSVNVTFTLNVALTFNAIPYFLAKGTTYNNWTYSITPNDDNINNQISFAVVANPQTIHNPPTWNNPTKSFGVTAGNTPGTGTVNAIFANTTIGSATVNVVGIDLQISNVDAGYKQSPGGFVPVNGDPAKLPTLNTNLTAGTSKGTVTFNWDNSKINLLDATNNNPIANDANKNSIPWPAGQQPVLKIQGITPSNNIGDIPISVTYTDPQGKTTTDCVNVTVLSLNLGLNGLDNTTKVNPGALLAVNAITPLTISLAPVQANLTVGTLKLKWDPNAITVIDPTTGLPVTDSNGNVTCYPDQPTVPIFANCEGQIGQLTWTLVGTANAIPATLTLLGKAPSDKYQNLPDQLSNAVTLEYTLDNTTIDLQDQVKVTVGQIKLDCQNLAQSQTTSIGAFIGVDADDVANQATPQSTLQNDLVPCTVTVLPADLPGSLTLTVPTNIKAYSNNNRTAQANQLMNVSAFPSTLYLEGVSASSTNPVTQLQFVYNYETMAMSNSLSTTVVDISFSPAPLYMTPGQTASQGMTVTPSNATRYVQVQCDTPLVAQFTNADANNDPLYLPIPPPSSLSVTSGQSCNISKILTTLVLDEPPTFTPSQINVFTGSSSYDVSKQFYAGRGAQNALLITVTSYSQNIFAAPPTLIVNGDTVTLNYTLIDGVTGPGTIWFTYSNNVNLNRSNQGSITLNVCNPLSAVTITTTPNSPVTIGTPVTLTAIPTGGANVQYQFTVNDGVDGPQVIQDFSKANSCAWTPVIPRLYTVTVTAVDVDNAYVTQAISYEIDVQ